LPFPVFLVTEPSVRGSEFVQRRRTTLCLATLPPSFSLLPTGKECLGPDKFSYFSNSLKFRVLVHFRWGVFGSLVRVPPSSFVSELSPKCPSSSLSGSYHLHLPVTSLCAISYNTWKISVSSTLLCEARDVDAIISTLTEPSGRD
jgi:hypothetical protein